jgi:hypothetical protein
MYRITITDDNGFEQCIKTDGFSLLIRDSEKGGVACMTKLTIHSNKEVAALITALKKTKLTIAREATVPDHILNELCGMAKRLPDTEVEHTVD